MVATGVMTKQAIRLRCVKDRNAGIGRHSTRHGDKDISRAETPPRMRARILMDHAKPDKKNPRRARVYSSSVDLQPLQIALSQLGGRAARILRNHLLQDATSLVVVTQATLDISQFEQ